MLEHRALTSASSTSASVITPFAVKPVTLKKSRSAKWSQIARTAAVR